MNKSSNNAIPEQAQTLRHETGVVPDLVNLAQFAILVSGLILVPLALMALGEETGPVATIKYLIIGIMAAGAAFAVVRFAITTLATLHAIGFRMAGLVAVVGITLAGAALAFSSLTALIHGSVEVKTYQTAGQELTGFVADGNRIALLVERIAPAVEAVSSDIDATVQCEISESCLSGKVATGRGPMTRALEVFSGKAFTIADALQAGELERAQHLEELNDLSADYFEVLGDEDLSISDRRAALQTIHAEVQQVVSALVEATPVHLVQGFVDELRQGAVLPGDPNGSRALSAYLRGHASSLSDQLDKLPEAELSVPQFPSRPGMPEVLRHAPDFLAFALIVVIGELILPLTLYIMTFMVRVREIEIIEGRKTPEEMPNPFAGLIHSDLLKPRKSDGDHT